MKRRISALLALFFAVCFLSGALVAGYDDALDAAFAAGRVVFEQAAFQMPDPATCEIVLPSAEILEAMGFPAMISEADIRAMLPQLQLGVLSYSADGTHGVGLLQSPGDNGGLPVAVSPGRIAMLCPTADRGVADTYGTLGPVYRSIYMQYKPNMPLGMDDTGMTWSPSGRYCCVLNTVMLYKYMQPAYCSPILMDTHTGEMFLMDAFEHRAMQSGFGAWITGCFSADERYFYALYCGNRYEERCTVLRYDLETCAAERVGEGFQFKGYPDLSLLTDGSLLILIDTRNVAQAPQYLAKIFPDGNTEMQPLPQGGERYQPYVQRMSFSSESGWAMLRASLRFMQAASNVSKALMLLRPEESLSDGMETLWAIRADTLSAEKLDAARLAGIAASAQETTLYLNKYLTIFDAKLSPDGRYAALAAGAPQQGLALLIVRLSDMAVLPAEGIDLVPYTNMVARIDTYMLNWSEAGLISINGGGLFRLTTAQ